MKIFLLFCLIFSISVQASNVNNQINIKGFYIGMTLDEIRKIIDIKEDNRNPNHYYIINNNFTLAGEKIFNLNIAMKDNKAEEIEIYLFSTSYESVKEALKSKIQSFSCKENVATYQNSYGANYSQTLCSAKDSVSTLLLEKYFLTPFGTLNTNRSVIYLQSNEIIQKLKNESIKNKSDI